MTDLSDLEYNLDDARKELSNIIDIQRQILDTSPYYEDGYGEMPACDQFNAIMREQNIRAAGANERIKHCKKRIFKHKLKNGEENG